MYFAKEVCNQHFYYLKYICPRYMHEMDEGSRHYLIAFFLFSLSVLVMYSLRTLNRDVMSLEIVASIEILRRKVNSKENELYYEPIQWPFLSMPKVFLTDTYACICIKIISSQTNPKSPCFPLPVIKCVVNVYCCYFICTKEG